MLSHFLAMKESQRPWLEVHAFIKLRKKSLPIVFGIIKLINLFVEMKLRTWFFARVRPRNLSLFSAVHAEWDLNFFEFPVIKFTNYLLSHLNICFPSTVFRFWLMRQWLYLFIFLFTSLIGPFFIFIFPWVLGFIFLFSPASLSLILCVHSLRICVSI